MDTLLQLGLANAALATLLALLAAVVARVCRRPAVVHSLWLLVLLKLLTPPLLELPVPWPAPGVEAVVEPKAAVHLVTPTLDVPDSSLDESPVLALTLGMRHESEADLSGNLTPEKDLTHSAPSSADRPDQLATPCADEDPAAIRADPEEQPTSRPAFSWQAAVVALWITGSLFWWTLAGWRLARFQALLRHAQPAPIELQEQVRQLAGHLGLARWPGVWLVPAPLPPLLWALAGSPRLLLPAHLWQQLTDEQRDTLLVHELAHWRRGDHWVRWLELVALGLYWWHPVAWWARRELQEAEEQCCDAWVVWALPASGPAYADALLATLAFLTRSAPSLPAGASGVGRLYPIKRRLSMILRGTTPRALSWPAFMGLLVLGGLLPLRLTWAQTAPPPPPVADAPKAADEPALPCTASPVPVLPLAAHPAPEKPAELPTTRSATEPASREALEKARDEVELAEVQVALKGAELREAQTRVQQAKRQQERMRQLGGAVSETEATRTRNDLELAEVQAEQKTYQLREVQLRQQQAKRRLDNLQRSTPTLLGPAAKLSLPPGPILATRETREDRTGLKELEKKLDTLLKEVEALRRELQQRKSSAGGPGYGDLLVLMNHRTFQIPFRVDQDRPDKVNGVELWASTDQGRTWKLVAQCPPSEKAFTFMASEDGLYWFTVRTVDDKGRRSPDDASLAQATLKVRVTTEK